MCELVSPLCPSPCCLPDAVELIFLYAPPSLRCDQAALLRQRAEQIISDLSTAKSCLQQMSVGQLITSLDNMNQFYLLNVSWNWNPIPSIRPSILITHAEEEALNAQWNAVRE